MLIYENVVIVFRDVLFLFRFKSLVLKSVFDVGAGLESFTDGAPFTLQRFCEVSESNFISFLSKRMLYDDICAIQIKLVSQVQLGNEVYGDIGNFVP